ncbi:outer membrane protein assembly factor BamA [bacterium]|nr:outer membrane protein assembly factor BamA [bacterium]
MIIKLSNKSIYIFLAFIFAASYSENIIHNISIIGTEFTSPELVRVNSGLEEGSQFSYSSLEDAVKSIYSLGNYEDVRLLASPGPYGYDIEIRVKENLKLDNIKYEGNHKLKDSELEKTTGLFQGEFLSKYLLFSSIQKIKKKYTEKGLFSVDVKYELEKSDKEGYFNLTFHIDEGEQKRVVEISFEGNNNISDKKLRSQMDTKTKWLFLRTGKFNPDKFQEDIDKIESYYHKNGYITAQVVKDSIIEKDDGLHIKIWVDEGKRYYFKHLEFSGNSVLSDEDIISSVKLHRGDVFNQEKMDKSLQNIYNLYSEIGYIHARVEPERKIDGDSVSVILKIDEGPQAHINMINIAGNTRTFEKVIRRELVIYPGDVFKRSLLQISYRNVYYLNYFEDVVPDFSVLPNGDVDITLNVTEKPVGRFQVGAGYNAVDKIVGNISIGWPNMLGRGWTLDLSYEFGKLKNNFSISFTEPWFLDTPTSVGFDLYDNSWTWEGYYTINRTGGAIRIGRKLLKPRYFSVFSRYKLELVEYTDISSNYVPSPSYDINSIDWPQLESSIMLTITRDSRNSRVFASSGSNNSISVESSGGPIGGDIEFQKIWLKSDWYFPAHKYLTLVGKCHLIILTDIFGDPESVPFGERLFPGGISFDGQIRGYSDRSVGPISWTEPVYDSTAIPDAGGRIPLTSPSYSYMPGGRAALILTAELRVPIMKDQLYISAFADAGNAWLSPDEINFSELKKSAGLGVRFVVPMMGILGLDFGYGFDKTKPGWEVHFQIGPEF